ncbi:hypothetical protein BaRGS_00032781 [Batillaria attramentaria]|uniref:G-protein coupled receptors family 1 profile domain-containing protein n=1 Tax=Batillaria attramentaria TaxID=370345 RepID=A0ABD0JLZ9_9CAEN
METATNSAGQASLGTTYTLTLSHNGTNSDGCLQSTSLQIMTSYYDETGLSLTALGYANRILQCGFSMLVAVAGVFANIINMIVYYKLGLHDRVSLCLFCLAFGDMMNLLNYVINVYDMTFQMLSGMEQILIRKSTPMAASVEVPGFREASYALYAFVALERCLCVLSPLRAKHWLKMHTTKFVIALIFVFCIALGGFVSTRNYFQCVYFTDTHRYNHIYVASPYYKANPLVYEVLGGLIQGFIVPSVCLGTVSVCTLISVVTLRRSARWRNQSVSAGGIRENQVTNMMIVVSCIFILSTTPSFLHKFMFFLVDEWKISGRFVYLLMFLGIVCEFLVNVNSAVNIIVYYLQGSRYREMFHRVFCHRCPSTFGKTLIHKGKGSNREGAFGVQGSSSSGTSDASPSND